ncbi:glycosyltransferase family 2 protein [Deinococcus roseus]|uniref:Beta-glycosyltransferase n=1 Tax=Deinococcus roseus TaxID=392414 RepID=A0ABQ2CVN0_9DEIO|nr:glycosyltransferase family 2 protein [Deinococcus roseus]GGJ24967.1 beta-glycosyltransferase [Deinococcus roseus]
MLEVSVITATYNRQQLLTEAYDHLRRMPLKEQVEWIIIDDGSTDQTETIVQGWIRDAELSIVYHRQQNKGRAAALNAGLERASKPIGFYLDSDDYLEQNAIEDVIRAYEENGILQNNSIAGVVFLASTKEGDLIGNEFPQSPMVSKPSLILHHFGVKGDKLHTFKTAVLKAYPFPLFENEKRVATSLVLNRMSLKYDFMYFNIRALRKDYTADGLSKNIDRVRAKSSNASRTFYAEAVDVPFMPLKARAKYMVNFVRYQMHSRGGALAFRRPTNYLLYLLLFIPGMLFYLKDVNKK